MLDGVYPADQLDKYNLISWKKPIPQSPDDVGDPPPDCEDDEDELPVTDAILLEASLADFYASQAALDLVPNDDYRAGVMALGIRLRDFIADYLLAACLAEARHLWRHSNYSEIYEASRAEVPQISPDALKSIEDYYNPRKMGRNDRINGSRGIWDALPFSKINAAKWVEQEVFLRFGWGSSYGGNPWAYIANVAGQLLSAPKDDPLTAILQIDQAAHIAHTGGAIFGSQKMSWCQYGQRLLQLMEFKANAKYCCWASIFKLYYNPNDPLSSIALPKSGCACGECSKSADEQKAQETEASKKVHETIGLGWKRLVQWGTHNPELWKALLEPAVANSKLLGAEP